MLEKEERDQGFCYRKVTFAQLYPGPEICTFYDSLNLRLSSSLLGVSHCQLHSTLTRCWRAVEAARGGCSVPGPGRRVHRGHLSPCIAEISSTNSWDSSQAFRHLSSALKNFSLVSVSGVGTGQISWRPGRWEQTQGTDAHREMHLLVTASLEKWFVSFKAE